ncbi:SDR family oxidoreductase [Deinococcus psychrotolerans]|uniref:SDR family oxidoreductase n=1 Tax=Deinococcus psychrotolerans TaxID=2489213 RepID=A0A3G8YE43_9DEIO|nr:SDR family oxidoreductase [Deinococcus psychrotolerans]AZI43582.1 SDR family oxidoreductase [Deinococcus psychrotolerans]
MQTNSELLSSLPTDTRLAGQTAVVTGSTSGIGEAIARVLAASGAEVVVSGRDAARAQGVVDAIIQAGGKAQAVAADLAGSYADLRRFVQEATAALGGQVDILVNNAGVYPVMPTEALPDADLDAILNTNIRAPHVLVGAVALQMVKRGSGHIVNIGSWMGRVGTANGAMYTASKAAVEQMTRNWAAEYGPRGVRVNTVAPGATLTPGNAAFSAVLDAMTSGTVAGRPVRPIDIAYAVRFLVSDEAAFLHGSILDVDGGMVNTRLKF